MPDKPKRRKNKNKRKNKNPNKNNVNISKSENSDTLSVDSCECQEENADEGCENNQSELDNANTTILENVNESQTDKLSLPSASQPLTLFDVCDKSGDKENVSISRDSDVIQVREVTTDLSACVVESNQNVTLSRDSDVIQVRDVTTDLSAYVVESPDTKKKKNPKLNNGIKSKSVDNDESPTIVEITEEADVHCGNEKSLAVVDTSNIIITDAESDVEWEKMDELHEIMKPDNLTAEAFSVMTIPLQIATCKQTQPLNADQEKSLRNYLQSLNLATSPSNLNSLEIRTEIEQIINREIKHRLRKKGLGEEPLFSRGTISRGLDVIDEEGSSESSATSRRHSYLSDKKSDTEELEDEVFENKQIVAFRPSVSGKTRSQRCIPQQCILVDAKIKEPEISEARGDWSLKTMETVTGAEVVYLTDSSSSTSSLYDVGEDKENDEVSDNSIRIITPTIEVTDTEKFLTNTFIAEGKEICKEELSQEIDNTNEITDGIKKISNNILQENLAYSIDHPHEILVLSTEDIKTNLFVKDTSSTETELEPNDKNDKENDKILNKSDINANTDSQKDTYDLEIKVLKCELNDAINNLIKEITPEIQSISENQKDAYTRQDSSSSVCSSQCTAKYNPNYSSLNDVSNIMHEDNTTSTINTKNQEEDFENPDLTSHVKEVFQCVSGDTTQSNIKICKNKKDPLALRDLCVKKIASFPFGNKVLEELAHVSERLQSMSILALQSKESSKLFDEKVSKTTIEDSNQAKMPYFPLPDISTIEKITISTKDQEFMPPPLHPRNSSLKKSQDEQHWTAIPTAIDPVYVCLSPSQKMLMEKTNTVIKKEEASQLMDIHKKFVDRRGYNEKLNENVDTTPIVPFKSQTGSRLFALIRDPTVTNNINLSSSQKKTFKSVESLPKLNYFDNKCNVNDSIIDSDKYTKSFKPIPPPRPRKYSSSFYESDESSDFTDNSFRSMRKEKKVFHYSTGNLNKEIENDISSIQNMHRYYSNIRDSYPEHVGPRRPSLPKDLCEQQMEYIRQKEKEVEEEIRRIEQERKGFERNVPRAPLILDEPPKVGRKILDWNVAKSLKQDTMFLDTKSRKVDRGKISSVFSKSQEELLREKMYSEYVNQMAEREQRRQQKFIKITQLPDSIDTNNITKSMPTLDTLESKVNNRIEKEFINRARERWQKLGIEDPVTEDEKELSKDIYKEPKIIEHKIKVIQAGEEKDLTKLPNHLQEFVSFTARTKEQENSRTGESEPEQEPTHVVVFCAVMILVLAVGKFVLRLLRNK